MGDDEGPSPTNPTLHTAQKVPREYCPAGHTGQLTEPTVELYWATGQDTQAVLPALGWYRPMGQELQEAEALVVENFPGGHRSQSGDPVLL